MDIFTDEDKRFYAWLSRVGEPQSARAFIKDGTIEIHVSDKYQAGALWRSLPILKLGQGSLKHVDLWVGKRLYLYTRHRRTLDDLVTGTPGRKQP
ncbi:hypothetical protein NDA01_23925 [Trichocoleus desertorum AS-A10]|uniref:hypothetical protein n=1 Tax=Trichocoleus desertorum TaxID=1481672 RepID=UPI003297A67B